MRLTILHFNDVHGRLEQLPRLATLIQRERAAALAAGRAVLVLDGGDSSDRARWESDVTKGRANFALLEAMGVQATVIGNGEALHWGRAALAQLVSSVHFPVLCANLVDVQNPAQLAVPGLRASGLFDFHDFKLGVVGATSLYADGYERFGYTAAPPRPALQQAVAELKAQGARAILLLSHLGSDYKFTDKDERYYHDEDAARDVPEIDLIIGAHTHRTICPPLRANNALIVQAGDYGKWLGRLEVELDDETGRVRAHAAELIPCDEQVPPDPTLTATLELAQAEAKRLLEGVIGHATQAWPHFIDQPSPLACRLADGLRALTDAELCIFFNGYLTQGLAAGPITRRALYEALPGAGTVTLASVSGAQLWRMVERMLASPYRTQSFNPKRNAPPMGLPAHSANVRLDYSFTTYQLQSIWVNDQPLDLTRRYRLVSTYFTLNPVTDDPEYDFIGVEPGQSIVIARPNQALWEVAEEWVKASQPL